MCAVQSRGTKPSTSRINRSHTRPRSSWPLYPLSTIHCFWTVGPFRPSLVRGDSPRNAPLKPLLAPRVGSDAAQCNGVPAHCHRACALPPCRRPAVCRCRRVPMPPCMPASTRSRLRPAPTAPCSSWPQSTMHYPPATIRYPPSTIHYPLSTAVRASAAPATACMYPPPFDSHPKV